ncbi:MAG: hypothetical protein QNK03_19230 [Myxococcota bacterium]|nr:hypothetical protein [Myxococcota bacterium]
MPRAIDTWVNVTMGGNVPPERMKRVAEDDMKRPGFPYENANRLLFQQENR